MFLLALVRNARLGADVAAHLDCVLRRPPASGDTGGAETRQRHRVRDSDQPLGCALSPKRREEEDEEPAERNRISRPWWAPRAARPARRKVGDPVALGARQAKENHG